jgi:two-component system response regulator HydG
MSPAVQVRLLRVLQEREVTRVGETQPVKIDVRVIAAANRNLEEEIKAGRFREDLYYRLSVFPIPLPPLRERREDIPFLAEHFLRRYGDAARRSVPGFSSEAMDALARHDWPGNVRELENEVQRALVLTRDGERIGLEALSERLRGRAEAGRGWRREGRLKDAVEGVEREMIRAAAEAHGGNKTRMAEQLGVSRWTLLQKMKEYGLE